MNPDFVAVATKYGVLCADGRTLQHGSFDHQDGERVPMVFQHQHRDHNQVLGHAILSAKGDGKVKASCFFNETESGRNAKILVQHGDIDSVSIFATDLVERGGVVQHGIIKELSLVLSGANPEAKIETMSIAHGDMIEFVEDEAMIYSGELIATESLAHAADEETIGDIIGGMSEKQRNAVAFLVNEAIQNGTAEHSNLEGGNTMKHGNLFDQNGRQVIAGPTLSHSDINTIFENAKKGGSFKEAFQEQAKAILQHSVPNNTDHGNVQQTLAPGFKGGVDYGIKDIELLFPDAVKINNEPEMIAREHTWVPKILGGVKKTPFTRIKMMFADITEEAARAKGYLTGSLKKEEVFKLMKRETFPTTVYKKQALDRDQILDITDMNVVAWMWKEMRFMLEEELARAIVFGDGRDVDDEAHINEDAIRPITKEDSFYAPSIEIEKDTTADADAVNAKTFIKQILKTRKQYKGSGAPLLIINSDLVTDIMLLEDTIGRKLYPTLQSVKDALRVSQLIEIEDIRATKEVGETGSEVTYNWMATLVNLTDYRLGTDKGGEITKFDDFDIDYNKYKYLIETRLSGSLVKHQSALNYWLEA